MVAGGLVLSGLGRGEDASRRLQQVIIGASMPPGVESLEVFRRLKLGDMVLTAIPKTKAEALAMAEYCAKNDIHLCFSELLWRGGFDLC